MRSPMSLVKIDFSVEINNLNLDSNFWPFKNKLVFLALISNQWTDKLEEYVVPRKMLHLHCTAKDNLH